MDSFIIRYQSLLGSGAEPVRGRDQQGRVALRRRGQLEVKDVGRLIKCGMHLRHGDRLRVRPVHLIPMEPLEPVTVDQAGGGLHTPGNHDQSGAVAPAQGKLVDLRGLGKPRQPRRERDGACGGLLLAGIFPAQRRR